MTTLERSEYTKEVADYVNLIQNHPQIAAETLCWDGIAAVIADINLAPQEDRDPEWILDRLDKRIDFLCQEIPGLALSPVAIEMRHKALLVRNAVITYQHMRAHMYQEIQFHIAAFPIPARIMWVNLFRGGALSDE